MDEDFFKKEAYKKHLRESEKEVERDFKLQSKEADWQRKQAEKFNDRLYKKEQDAIKQEERAQNIEKRHELQLDSFNYKTAIQQGLNAEAAKVLSEKEVQLSELAHAQNLENQKIQLKRDMLFLALELQDYQNRLDSELLQYEEKEDGDQNRRITEDLHKLKNLVIEKMVEMIQQKVTHQQSLAMETHKHELLKDKMTHENELKKDLETFLMELQQEVGGSEKTDEEILAILSKHMK